MDVRGIVDGDCLGGEARVVLANKGVHVLPFNEVESLYLLPKIMSEVARRVGGASGLDDAFWQDVESDPNTRVVAASNAVKMLRLDLNEQFPSRRDVSEHDGPFEFRFENGYESQCERLADCITSRDWMSIIREFSVRDSPIVARAAKAAGIPTFRRYKEAAIAALEDDGALRSSLREEIGAPGGVEEGSV